MTTPTGERPKDDPFDPFGVSHRVLVLYDPMVKGLDVAGVNWAFLRRHGRLGCAIKRL
jgi:hypothetical protein